MTQLDEMNVALPCSLTGNTKIRECKRSWEAPSSSSYMTAHNPAWHSSARGLGTSAFLGKRVCCTDAPQRLRLVEVASRRMY